MLNVLPLPVVMVNSHGEVLFANRAFAEQLGGEDAPAGKPVEQVLPEGPLCDMVLSGLRRRLSSCRAEEMELPVAGGQAVPYRCRLVPLWITKPEWLQPRESPAEQRSVATRGERLGRGRGACICGARILPGIVIAPTESEVVRCVRQRTPPAQAPRGGWRRRGWPSALRGTSGGVRGVGADSRAMPQAAAGSCPAGSFPFGSKPRDENPVGQYPRYAELLADGDAEDPATREEFFQVINTQVDRLQRLVQNLLDLARIEAGIMQVQKRTLSLNEILEEAAEVVRPTAAAKSLRLQTELSPLFLPVCVDRDLMLQAAINLLSNAIKYTPSGGQITLRSRLADDQVIFQVEDTGVGLTEEECARIFERFYRVKRNEKLAEGTGLGLALVKSIVEELHGGQISVESSVGKGTTFTVRLPAVHQAAAA